MDSSIDFRPLDEMLREYVSAGAVDYKRWQVASIDRLEQWLSDVSAVDIEQLTRDGAIAFLINLYNALTIRQILQKYPIDSIRPEILGIPNWASFLLFFKGKIYTLNGRSLSLDNIEKDILQQRYSEPRMHFALVCASSGCPLLRSGAYFPEQVNEQLEEDAHRFINNPEKVDYDADRQTLYCSKIFEWYEEDFLKQADSVPQYIQSYLGNAKIPTTVEIAYLPYSWALNQRTSS